MGVKLPNREVDNIIFASQSSSGCVFGVTHSKRHVTLVIKEDSVSSHLTDEEHKRSSHIGEILLTDLQRRLESGFIKPKILTPEELNHQVLYFTEKMVSSFNYLVEQIFKEEREENKSLSYLDQEAIAPSAISFFQQIRTNPDSYIGLCKADRILWSKEGECFMTDSGKIILKSDDILYEVDMILLFNIISEFASSLGAAAIEDDFQNRMFEISSKSI